MNETKQDRKLLGFFAVAFFVGVALCVVLGGCLPATREAGIRRVAEHRLATCRQSTQNVEWRKQCNEDSKAFCLARGVESTCGEGC